MRSSNRNKQTFWYALHGSVVEDYDEYENQIGTHVNYGNPKMARGNISPARGEVVARVFGDDDLYDRVIGPMPIDTEIDEYAVLWIDETPSLNDDGSLATDDDGNAVTPHNYIVTKKASSLPKFGGVMFAVDKVTVT